MLGKIIDIILNDFAPHFTLTTSSFCRYQDQKYLTGNNSNFGSEHGGKAETKFENVAATYESDNTINRHGSSYGETFNYDSGHSNAAYYD